MIRKAKGCCMICLFTHVSHSICQTPLTGVRAQFILGQLKKRDASSVDRKTTTRGSGDVCKLEWNIRSRRKSLPVLLLNENKSHFKKLKNDSTLYFCWGEVQKGSSYCHKGWSRLYLPALDITTSTMARMLPGYQIAFVFRLTQSDVYGFFLYLSQLLWAVNIFRWQRWQFKPFSTHNSLYCCLNLIHFRFFVFFLALPLEHEIPFSNPACVVIFPAGKAATNK